MTIENERYQIFKTVLHIIFAVFGGITMSALSFGLLFFVMTASHLIGVIVTSNCMWVFSTISWAVPLWYLFFLLSSPRLKSEVRLHDHYIIVLAFTGGGMVSWAYLILLLFEGGAIRNWRYFIALMAVPIFGYVIAAITHTIAKNYYRRPRVQQESGQ
ncbi:hypothetical protein KBD34_00100 [Patescibacteria group bacterium]|nr:hypothetical protein [Patescibacteria group bacterium]